MVGFTRRAMSDKRGTMSNGRDRIAGLVETMLKLHGTASSLWLTAYDLGLWRQRGSRFLDTLNWGSMIVSE